MTSVSRQQPGSGGWEPPLLESAALIPKWPLFQMSHSQSTSAKYYQAVVGRRDAAKAYLLRQKLVEQAEKEERVMVREEEDGMKRRMSRRKGQKTRWTRKKMSTRRKMSSRRKMSRRKWWKRKSSKLGNEKHANTPFFSDEENEQVRRYFQKEISNKVTPSLEACQDFVTLFKSSRSSDKILAGLEGGGHLVADFFLKVPSHLFCAQIRPLGYCSSTMEKTLSLGEEKSIAASSSLSYNVRWLL